jgi:hypothetical protein
MPEGSGATRVVAIDAAVQCPRCRATVQLAGPVLHARCYQCENQISISQVLWIQTLAEVDERSFDAGTLRTATGACRREQVGVHLLLEWSRSEPTCGLRRHVPREAIPVARSRHLSPPLPTRRPGCAPKCPPASPRSRCMFDAAALTAPARRFWVAYQGTPPRKAVAKQMFIEQEIVALSQRTPQTKEGVGYLIPLLLALVVIAFATYYVVSALHARGEDDLMEIE